MILLTDQDIKRLLSEKKLLPNNFPSCMKEKQKRGHKERELKVAGVEGSEFRIIVRQLVADPLDFSVILAYQPADSNRLFILRRYNGKSHPHTNTIEGEEFGPGFHIHEATERYQLLGSGPETYAEVTDRYSDLESALECLVNDCGFEYPSVKGPLFEEGN